jgi:hypothetical protein
MWDNGFRPEINKDSAGALVATQDHLKDMQKIAFDQLEKQGNPIFITGGSSNGQGDIKEEFNT